MTVVDTERYPETRRVTLVGALVNVILAILKVAIGVVAQSHALIADGVHSLSDLLSDGIVLYAAKHGSRGADEHHPYGHARIETAFTVGLGVMLIAVALGFIFDAGRRLLSPEELLHPAPLALLAAAGSVLAKEWLYRYTMSAARRLRSSMLRANAWHHRSDAISSVVVLVGVAGALLGLDYLDAFAAVAVALMVAKIGWDLAWHAVRELVDTGLDPQRVALIRQISEQVEGARGIHQLRTRRMGGEALVDVHVQVSPRLSVSEGHQIGEYVRRRLVEGLDEVSDVTVHIDAENDEAGALGVGLPLRREVLAQLRPAWEELIPVASIERIDLHYLGGEIHVDLVLPVACQPKLPSIAVLAEQLKAAVPAGLRIGVVRVYLG